MKASGRPGKPYVKSRLLGLCSNTFCNFAIMLKVLCEEYPHSGKLKGEREQEFSYTNTVSRLYFGMEPVT